MVGSIAVKFIPLRQGNSCCLLGMGKKPFTATSTVRRSTYFLLARILSMDNQLSGIMMEGFVNCYQQSWRAPKDIARKTEWI